MNRICIVGSMLRGLKNHVPNQGEIVADFLRKEGYSVQLTSSWLQQGPRLFDIIKSLIVWQRQYDIVVIMVFSGKAFMIADLASLIAKWLGKPIVFWFHGGDLPNFYHRKPAWVSRVIRRSPHLVTPSHFLADFFTEKKFSVRIIPNVLSIEEYPFRLRREIQPTLLWMRAFHEIYQPTMAIEVLSRLLDIFPEATLTMAGPDKGELHAVQSLVSQKQLHEKVRFVGYLDMAAKQREFASHDIYLNTNRIDNMPVTVLEAGAFGLPIVATNVGGIPFLLTNGENALLVKDGDTEGIVAAIQQLLLNQSLVEHLSYQGRQLAERSAWPQVRKLWEQLFVEVDQNGSKD